MIIKNHFHKKGFALGLVLKQTELNFLANGSNRQTGELTLAPTRLRKGRNLSLLNFIELYLLFIYIYIITKLLAPATSNID